MDSGESSLPPGFASSEGRGAHSGKKRDLPEGQPTTRSKSLGEKKMKKEKQGKSAEHPIPPRRSLRSWEYPGILWRLFRLAAAVALMIGAHHVLADDVAWIPELFAACLAAVSAYLMRGAWRYLWTDEDRFYMWGAGGALAACASCVVVKGLFHSMTMMATSAFVAMCWLGFMLICPDPFGTESSDTPDRETPQETD